MGRKKYKAEFVDIRGRWLDNQKLIRQIVDLARAEEDWTELLKPILCEDSVKEVGIFKGYKNPPDLRMLYLDEYELTGINLKNANLYMATLYRSEANDILFKDCYAVNTRWKGSSVLNGKFNNVNFQHSNFTNTDLSGSVFIRCKLSNCNFRNAVLKNAIFIECDLRHSNLNEAEIDEAEFNTVKLYGASLWDIKYENIKADNIDLSRNGNMSVLTNDIRIAPLLHLLEDNKLVEVINSLKSNTVVILGSDSDAKNKTLLETIGAKAKSHGFTPIIVKNLKEIEGESFTKKAVMYSLLAKFVIIENSLPSGHILEFSKVLDLGCIVGVLQQKNNGSTWLLEENFIKYPFHLNRFFYENDLEEKINETYKWCIEQHELVSNKLSEMYKELNLKKVKNN